MNKPKTLSMLLQFLKIEKKNKINLKFELIPRLNLSFLD